MCWWQAGQAWGKQERQVDRPADRLAWCWTGKQVSQINSQEVKTIKEARTQRERQNDILTAILTSPHGSLSALWCAFSKRFWRDQRCTSESRRLACFPFVASSQETNFILCVNPCSTSHMQSCVWTFVWWHVFTICIQKINIKKKWNKILFLLLSNRLKRIVVIWMV